MTKLSVNINKIATIRNARGGNIPNLIQFAIDCESFGAQGITVHPRPDERHIRYADVLALKPVVKTEFNVEGNPNSAFMDLVLKLKPHQVTLVPDAENVLTSNAGWDTLKHAAFLKDIVSTLKKEGIRTSIFLDPVLAQVQGAFETGTDRIELYTEAYAAHFESDAANAIQPFKAAAKLATQLGLGINAGHDLNLKNLSYFRQNIPELLEVSIGHALVSDSLYLGIHNTIQMYKKQLQH